MELTEDEILWVKSHPSTHHLIPQKRLRRLANYSAPPPSVDDTVTAATWAGVSSAQDKPAGIIACDKDGHHHPDAFICSACATELSRHLADIPALVLDLHIAVAKDVHFPERGSAFGGSRKDEAPVNFNLAARAAVNQLREALPWPDRKLRIFSWSRPVEGITLAAQWAELNLPNLLKQPDIGAVAGAISRAVVHGRSVIDRPREVIYYGVCPKCSGDIWQERVDTSNKDARIVCPRGCGYNEKYLSHEQTALNAGEDRWLTEDELVGAIQSAGEVVSRKQIRRWVKREGLPREKRVRPQLVNGAIKSVEVEVYRLGDVRQMAADAELDRVSLTSDQVAALLGVSQAAVRKMVQRGDLVPNRAGAKPLRFSRESLGNHPKKSADCH